MLKTLLLSTVLAITYCESMETCESMENRTWDQYVFDFNQRAIYPRNVPIIPQENIDEIRFYIIDGSDQDKISQISDINDYYNNTLRLKFNEIRFNDSQHVYRSKQEFINALNECIREYCKYYNDQIKAVHSIVAHYIMGQSTGKCIEIVNHYD